jgi:carbamoyltransferase
MKLLSVSLPRHDANLAWFDGVALHYIKCERTRQQKRFAFDAAPDWQAEARALWGVQGEAVDDAVFTLDPSALPPAVLRELGPELLARVASDQAKAQRLPPAACRFLGVPRGWLLSHHYAHALSTWMLEERPPAVRIVIDGLGDGRPWSVYRNEQLVAAGDIRHGSIGWGIREAGKLLGVAYGHYNDIAGKVMGLQAHGTVDAGYLQQLRRLAFTDLKQLWAPEPWMAYRGDALVGHLGLLDWVATVHLRMGEMLVEFFRRFVQPGEAVSYSGGVAQNVAWNALLQREFPGLVVPPHASDEGLSLGGIEWLRHHHGLPALQLPGFPYAQSDTPVAAPSGRTINSAAQVLAQGGTLGWYQGHGEIGPRALGNRSILMDPRLADGKQRLNRVKLRENYRPFGASVLQEHAQALFEGPADAFMLRACRVRSEAFPAVTHVDGSCRLQLVGAGDNAPFRALLERFHQLTGCPLLVNTSLNLAGKPLAAAPQQALALWRQTPLDALVVGDEVHLNLK